MACRVAENPASLCSFPYLSATFCLRIFIYSRHNSEVSNIYYKYGTYKAEVDLENIGFPE